MTYMIIFLTLKGFSGMKMYHVGSGRDERGCNDGSQCPDDCDDAARSSHLQPRIRRKSDGQETIVTDGHHAEHADQHQPNWIEIHFSVFIDHFELIIRIKKWCKSDNTCVGIILVWHESVYIINV